MSGGSYSMALEVAGATVHDCRWFGSYQGEWIAHVTLPDGRTGIIMGYYGSCSGCDSFEAEFGYESHSLQINESGEEEYHSAYGEFRDGCEQCADYRRRLAEFGMGYFMDFRTIEEAAKVFVDEKQYWSTYDEDEEQARFIQSLLPADSPLVAELEAAILKAKESI